MINVSLALETSLERISLLRPRVILKTVGNCENFSIYFYTVRVFTFEMVERDILEMRIFGSPRATTETSGKRLTYVSPRLDSVTQFQLF